MADVLFVRVSERPADPAEALALVADPAAGGTCVFVGTVRDRSNAGEVRGIRYEAWKELAERRMAAIAQGLLDDRPLRKVAILHRYGELAVGDVSVVVAVSAAHRAEAFEACREGIERLKQDVPIWKKELLSSGASSWVMGS